MNLCCVYLSSLLFVAVVLSCLVLKVNVSSIHKNRIALAEFVHIFQSPPRCCRAGKTTETERSIRPKPRQNNFVMMNVDILQFKPLQFPFPRQQVKIKRRNCHLTSRTSAACKKRKALVHECRREMMFPELTIHYMCFRLLSPCRFVAANNSLLAQVAELESRPLRASKKNYDLINFLFISLTSVQLGNCWWKKWGENSGKKEEGLFCDGASDFPLIIGNIFPGQEWVQHDTTGCCCFTTRGPDAVEVFVERG